MTLSSRRAAQSAADAAIEPEVLDDPGGQILQIVSAFRDARPTAPGDAAAERGERGYRRFLEALGVAVYTTDADGKITFYNEAAADFWGRRPDLGEEWCGSWRLFRPDGSPLRHDECPMAVALKENRPVRGEQAIAERPDGTRRSFVPYPTPLRDPSGSLVGAVNVLVDITERTRAEEAVRRTADALRASNAVKDEFLGLVSHELRTPVTTIFGNAQLLRERFDSLADEKRRAMIGDIAEDSERLLGIVENLLLLTRLESGTQLDLEPQILVHVIRQATDRFGQRHPDRPVHFRGRLRDAIVEADRTYLGLLMDNLLGNAEKYSPPGTEIEVVVRAVDDEAQVVVLDRGIGIDARDAEHLFTPFYRGEKAKRRANGVGVGLAVCRRMVESQGGRIWARPRPDGGSEFGFALPLARDPGELLEPGTGLPN